ncbi:MAG: cadherin domain-containing protein, partial [Pirellulales bacterium]|nr:cadherin domain-containing protein [Pirellulales bacterium]
MRTSLKKSRKHYRAAKTANALRLEFLEPRTLLSGNPLADLQASHPLLHADSKNVWTSDAQILPTAGTPLSGTGAGVDGFGPLADAMLPSGSINPLDTITYDTRADGMPILNSLPGAPGNIFLDFDGDAASSYLPFSMDADGATFNATEQSAIVDTWRRTVDFFSMFDVNVTTIQPDVATQPTAWHVITPSYNNGGLAWGTYPNTTVGSITDGNWSPFNVTEAIAHEVGHTFTNGHIAKYDSLGNMIQEYAVFSDPLSGSTMGGSSGVVNEWRLWHANNPWWNPNGDGAAYLQDDMSDIAALIDNNAPAGYTGDGYRTDDFGGTIATAQSLDVSGNIQVHTGIIERLTDADAFSFASAGGRYSIIAAREAPSPVDLKLSIYDSAGALIAAEDADPRDQPYAMANDQYITLDLAAGTYYAIVQSHGNYSDQGKYVVRVDPLPGGAPWNLDGVGLNSNPGYASYDAATGTYTLAGSGHFIYPSTSSSIGGTADSFQYEYQTLQGDGQIVARVSSLSAVYNPKAGIAIRDSLDSNAMSAAVVLTSTSNAAFITRSAAGGNSTTATHSATTAYWLKLTRTGNVFRAYYSTNNGSSWTQFGSNQTINMGATVYIGLAATANLNSWGSPADPTGPQLNVATFTNVSVSATGSGVLNPTLTLDAGLSAPAGLVVTGKTSSSINLSWNDVSGETGYRVERSTDGVNFKQIGVTAAGVSTSSDSALTDSVTTLPLYQTYFYRVRSQSAAGYSQPSAAVSATPRAGPISNLVVNSISPTQLVLDWEDASGETGYRIERSLDGVSGWTTAGTVGQNVPSFTNSGLTANTRYYYRVVTLDALDDAATSAVASRYTRLSAASGLAFATKAAYQMAFQWTAVAGATSYRIERSTNGSSYTTINSSFAGTTYTDNSVSPTTEYYYRVTALNSNIEGVASSIFAASPAPAALPTPWLTQDIGGVGGTGAAKYSNGTFTLIGGGGEIWGSSDQFRYVYQNLAGNGSLTAQVTSVENTNYWAKVGLMVRASTSAGAKEAMIYTSPNMVVFQSRNSTNGSTSDQPYGPSLTAPLWLRITRTISGSSSIIKGEYSSDNVTWTELRSTTISNMSGTVLIGFAVTARDNSLLNTSTFSISPALTNVAPTVATAAAASPSPVTGTTATLSALGADDLGEGNLTYTWTATSVPSGAPAPTYSANGTNAAKSTTVTFGKAGNYTFRATIADCNGLSVTSTVAVTVNQTPSTLTVSPATVALAPNATQLFTAAVKDQFGAAISPAPAISWSATAGTITSGGLYTAPGSGTSATITAASGAAVGTATAILDSIPPTVATPAAAAPNPVTGTTTNLSVLGSDNNGEAGLKYTWIATVLPPEAAPPVFSVNGTNAAKNAVATFSKAGDYTFQVTIADAVGLSAASTVNVTVEQTLASIVVSPAAVGVPPNTTKQFAATGLDQFGGALSVQPAFSWSAASGSITSAGLYTAPAFDTTDTVQAASGAITSNSAVVTVTNAAPTVATAAAANPSPVTGTTTALSVLGADDGGEGNLTYTWTAVLLPTGAPQPVFAENGTNAAKNTTAEFATWGTYRLRATIADSGGESVASFLWVTVNRTISSVVVAPDNVDLPLGGSQQFAATAYDQFGEIVNAGFVWSATAGSITANGLYTAPTSPTAATVQATSISTVGAATVNAVNFPPTNILLSGAAVDENQAGAAVGTLSTVDPDQGQTFAYALQNDPTGKFEVVGNTLKLKAGESLDREATPTVELLLRTTDSGGMNFDKTFTIAVGDLPETLLVGVGDWTAAGLTLQLGGDGKLHVYRTGGTEDAVPPHAPAMVLGIDIAGNGLGDVMTAVSMGAGIPELSVKDATLIFSQDNALSAGANVTVDGGILDLNHKAGTLGGFTLLSGGVLNGILHAASYRIESGSVTAAMDGPGELLKTTVGAAVATEIGAATVTVEAGQLSATSIITESLIVGGVAAALPPISSGSNHVHLAAPMPDGYSDQIAEGQTSGGTWGLGPLGTIIYDTLANGLPILHSYPSVNSRIFLDFDGNETGGHVDPYDEDGDPTTFNTAEQVNIVEAWRQASVYFAMFNVDVTTDPAVTANLNTNHVAWMAFGGNISNAYSAVNAFPNSWAEAFSQSSYARNRQSVIPHEIGHNFGANHTSTYNNLGVKTAEYSGQFDPLHGPIMGVDYAGVIHKWTTWHVTGDNPSSLQDDMLKVSQDLDNYGGDGYRSDDYAGSAGSIAGATPLLVSGVTQSVTGIIERLNDVDTFSFSSAGGRYAIAAGRDAPSGVDLKISVYNSSGTRIATEDGDPRAQPTTMVYDQYLTMDLSAGTYYVQLECRGNYGDQGQYVLRVDPLPSFWNSEGVGLTGVPGFASYNSGTSTYTVSGSGSDIWGTADGFQYLYQTLSGNGSITARVASLENTDYWAKTGLMIRESLAPDAKHAMVYLSPNTSALQWRTSTGGSVGDVYGASVTAPYWIRLTRSGSTFTGEISTNGTTWTLVGTRTISMNTSVLIGLAVTSHNNGLLNTSTYTNVTLTGTLNPGPTLNAIPAPAGLAVTGKTASSISLSWNDASGETGYSIERSSDGISFAEVGTTAAGVLTYTATGLADFNRYYFRVRARDAAGVSLPSAVVNDITRAGAVSNLRVISYTQSTLVLDWTDAGGETGYRVERSTNGTTWSTVTTRGVNVPLYSNSGLSGSTQYYYRVVTLDGGGDAAVSGSILASTRLNTPTGSTLDSSAAGKISFHWNAVTAATSYRVEYSTDSGATYATLASGVTATNYTHSNVTSGQLYYYRVVGVNTLTESISPSAAIQATGTSNQIPTVVTPAAAAPNPAAGTTTVLSVLGADDGGEANLTYTWSATSIPSGAPAPTYSVNGTNAAKNTTVTFGKAGSYTFRATIADSGGLSVTSTIVVTVNQTATTVTVTPSSVALGPGGTQLFTAAVNDQFGAAISPAPAITWSATAGSITTGGLYTAPGSGTSITVTATSGGMNGTASVTVDSIPPTVATPAAANPNPAIGTTTNLSVLGGDNNGEAGLKYTWIATVLPQGAAPPTFSVNGTNAAKNTVATFSKAGDYTFQVTIADAVGLSIASAVNVTVEETLASIVVSPASANVPPNTTKQFAATGLDQFGGALSVQPVFTWTAVSGSITADGLYTAPAFDTTDTIKATSGAIFGAASATVTNDAPTVATAAVANPSPVTGITTALSVLGADDGGEANLTYTWTAVLLPSGAPQPVFAENGTNAAKNTTAEFATWGTYRLRATITDTGGLSVTSLVFVTVNRTIASVVVAPDDVDLPLGGTQQFTATAYDQFGNVINAGFVWSATAGSITTYGFYTAPTTPTAATVQATSISTVGTAAVNVANSTPTNLLLSNAALDENQTGAVVGTLSTVDPDQGETFTYLLQNDPTGKFEIAGNTLKLKAGESLDREATPTVDLLLRTTDSGGLFYDKAFTIAVNDVPETPTDILLSNAAIDENALGTAVGTLSTVDPDQGETFTYLLQSDPTGKFEIAGNTLKLKAGESLDREATPTVDLLLRTTDSGGLF